MLAEAAEAYQPDPKCPGCGAWRNCSAAAGVPSVSATVKTTILTNAQ